MAATRPVNWSINCCRYSGRVGLNGIRSLDVFGGATLALDWLVFGLVSARSRGEEDT